MKTCGICKNEKPNSDFYTDRSKKGFRWMCKVCDRARIKGIQSRFKLKCLEYCGGPVCTHCGYDRYIGALDFHHTDPSQKDFTVSSTSRSEANWDKVSKELDKCIVLCSNCHREEHDRLSQLS